MRERIRAAIAAIVMILATWSVPAMAADTSYISRLPTVDRIVADHSSGSREKNGAQQAAVCLFMMGAISTMRWPDAPAKGHLSPVERTRYDQYSHCIDSRKPASNAPRAVQDAFATDYNGYSYDAKFKALTIDRYIAAQDRPLYDKNAYAMAHQYDDIEAKLKARSDEVEITGIGPALISVAPYLLIMGALGIWGLLRFLRWAKPFRYDPRTMTLQSGNRVFSVHHDSGILVNLQRERHTVTTSDTVTRDYSGNIMHRTPGSSRTDTYTTLFIRNGRGEERATELVNLNVTASPGNLMTAIWAIRKGQRTGQVFHVRNFTLDQSWTRGSEVRKLVGIGWLTVFLLYATVSALMFALNMLNSLYMLFNIGAPSMMPMITLLGLLLYVGLLIAILMIGGRRVSRFNREVIPSLDEYTLSQARTATG